MRPAKLDPEDARRRVEAELPEWSCDGESIARSIATTDFATAMRLANVVAELADRADHHPDLHVSWGLLKIDLHTHDAGGVTTLDLDLAAAIDRSLGPA